MRFSLDVLPARKGDCLMIHLGSEQDPGLVMIDGGPKQVYNPFLKPRLAKIRKAQKLVDDAQLIVDLLMVSHIDDDHIQGILDLTKELTSAPPWLKALSFWHDSFNNVIGDVPKELTAAFTSQFGPASMAEDPPDDLVFDLPGVTLDQRALASSMQVLASIPQGAQLRADAEKLGFSNPEFGEHLIMAQKGGDPKDIREGLTFTVLGPMPDDLTALHEEHQKWLKELKEEGKTPADVLAAYADESVTNLSSIVVLAKTDKTDNTDETTMLLTGDARGDKILEGLEFAYPPMKKGGKIHVNILKAPHHGSSNNIDPDFFERITADHYVFSGNGEHGNPERDTLQMLINARGETGYHVHLTYPVATIDVARKKEWEKQQLNEKTRKPKHPKITIRPDWSHEQHSLAALLAKHPKFAETLSIVEPGKPHVIDLLDPCGF
jgi:beta-lactamase superfamily II metal-dependent hydrolase